MRERKDRNGISLHQTLAKFISQKNSGENPNAICSYHI